MNRRIQNYPFGTWNGWMFIFICVVTFGIGGCASQGHTPVSPAKNSQIKEQVLTWFHNEPCLPPCWEGITPDETNAQTAVEILKQSKFANNVRVGVPSVVPDLGSITWKWDGETQGGKIYFHAQSPAQTIYSIEVDYPIPVTFQQAMQAYGEPTHIIAVRNKDIIVMTGQNTPSPYEIVTYNIELIYLDRGLRFPVIQYKTDSYGLPILDKSIVLQGSRYYAPTLEGLGESFGGTSLTKFMVPWGGFKDFRYYCRDRLTEKTCE